MSLATLRDGHHFPAQVPNVPPSDHGWFGPEHVELLTPFLNPSLKIILEVGSWLGKSTRFMATHAPNATIIAIDTWRGSKEHRDNAEWNRMLPQLYETFLRSCWDFRDRIIPIRDLSWDALQVVSVHEVKPELIYLDGSHEYEDVKKDLLHILTLFPNSNLAGDDIMWPGVERALREMMVPRGVPIWRKGNVWWKSVPGILPLVGGHPAF